MEVENAASSEIPSSCHEKKKRKRQEVDKNIEANYDCPEGTSLGKDTSLEPPVKICTDVEAIMLEPPTNVTSEKKSKKKRRKTNDDVCKISVSTKLEDTTLEPPVGVASEKKKKKKTSKTSDDVVDNDSAFLDYSASMKDAHWEPPVNIRLLPTEVETTTLELPASVTSEKKKKKKKSRTSNDVVDNDIASLDNIDSVKDTPREPPVDISTIPTEVEATTLEPQASVTSEKKKKKKKKKSKTSDDFKMHAMDHESALVRDTLREPLVNTDNVAVFTNPDAATSDPTSVTSEKRKKKKRSKTSYDIKMNSTDHESVSVKNSAAVKDTPLEPPINSYTMRIRAESEEATTLEPPANVTSEKKKKKKKSKAVSDSKMDALDHEGAPLENTASTEDTPVVPLVNLPMIAVPTEAEVAITLDPLSNVASEKKKKKKKRKAGSDSKLDALDHESTPLENTASVENTPVAHLVNLPMIAVPTEAEAEAVTTSDILTTLTSEKKKKKKKIKAGSDSKIDGVPTEETITSEPPRNLASEKKKKKKKSKRSDDSKMNGIDHESALLENSSSAKDTPMVPLVNLSTMAVPAKAEEATTSEPQASEKKKKKKKSKTSDNFKMKAMDHESALLENSASAKDAPMMPLVNLSTTAADAEATLLEPPPNAASNKKKKKKRKTSDDSKTNAIDHESASVDNSASERHLHVESVVGIDTVTKSEMCRSESVHSKELVMTSEKKKRKRSTAKEKDQNKFSKMGEEKDQNKFKASDIDGMDHTLQQNVALPSQGDLVSEVAELNSTGLKAKSPTSEERSSLTKGVNGGSIKKCGGYTEFCDVTYRRRKKNYDTGMSNSSDSGDTRQPVEDKDNNDTSSPCVAEENISGSLDSKFEKNSSGLGVISEQDADILIARDSVRVLDDEPESLEREIPVNISDLRETSSRNNVLNNSTKVHVSEGICEQKNGGMLVAGQDAYKDETSSCKENGSGDISKLDAVKMEISREEAPSSSNHGEVDLAYLDASCKEENVSQMPNTLPERCLVARSKKKLLILDVNGILVEFVSHCPFQPDIRISKKGVFKRPYCDDFLQFCFDRFNVGVWSSRMKFNVDKVVDFLFGQTKHKLLFCWDQSHCTPTGLNTIENKAKPLVLKELRKVWEKVEPDLPFEKGEYDETNTLLLDDSPYKALRNPVNTAVFPYPYRFRNRHDNSLGPGGDLRTYLEGLSMADNVKEYLERNPFGQGAITESHRQWDFYSKIVGVDKPVLKL